MAVPIPGNCLTFNFVLTNAFSIGSKLKRYFGGLNIAFIPVVGEENLAPNGSLSKSSRRSLIWYVSTRDKKFVLQ